jgi:hypothetical protein
MIMPVITFAEKLRETAKKVIMDLTYEYRSGMSVEIPYTKTDDLPACETIVAGMRLDPRTDEYVEIEWDLELESVGNGHAWYAINKCTSS